MPSPGDAPAPLQARAERLLARCERVELIEPIRATARTVRPTTTRTLDAIHVATALIGEVACFASFDTRQNVAAEEMGLRLLAL